MLWLAAIALLVLFTLGFRYLVPEQARTLPGTDEAGRAMVVLQRDRSGHYLAEGAINDQAVAFLVDTGATDVAISERLARQLGVEFGPRITVLTAAGPAQAWVTRLENVSVGGLRQYDVRATITPGLGDQALLGMSFLKNYSIRQQGDRLEIAPAGGEDTT
jgi:aspartyl protease family protein